MPTQLPVDNNYYWLTTIRMNSCLSTSWIKTQIAAKTTNPHRPSLPYSNRTRYNLNMTTIIQLFLTRKRNCRRDPSTGSNGPPLKKPIRKVQAVASSPKPAINTKPLGEEQRKLPQRSPFSNLNPYDRNINYCVSFLSRDWIYYAVSDCDVLPTSEKS